MRTSEENLAPRRYFVKHRTTYRYSEPVLQCLQRGFLGFRQGRQQTVLAHAVDVSPEPRTTSTHTDAFGNESWFLEIDIPHTTLEVVKEAVVDVAWSRVNVDLLDQWSLDTARRAIAAASGHALERAMYGLPSRLVRPPARLQDYMATFLTGEMGYGQALEELTRGIHRDFTYASGTTSVHTTVDELLDLQAGVCQDFAHLGIAILRTLGIPARYVSGYIETQPPPGREKLEGSDASHAWIAALAPDGQWIHLDPTNDQFVDSRYVITAWGRDFSDASPLRGIIQTEALSSELDVGVDMVRMDDDTIPAHSVTGLSLG